MMLNGKARPQTHTDGLAKLKMFPAYFPDTDINSSFRCTRIHGQKFIFVSFALFRIAPTFWDSFWSLLAFDSLDWIEIQMDFMQRHFGFIDKLKFQLGDCVHSFS